MQTLRKKLRKGWKAPTKPSTCDCALANEPGSVWTPTRRRQLLANIPSKCERRGATTAWMNDKYRPGLLLCLSTALGFALAAQAGAYLLSLLKGANGPLTSRQQTPCRTGYPAMLLQHRRTSRLQVGFGIWDWEPTPKPQTLCFKVRHPFLDRPVSSKTQKP